MEEDAARRDGNAPAAAAVCSAPAAAASSAYRAVEKMYKLYKDGRNTSLPEELLDIDTGSPQLVQLPVAEGAAEWLREAKIFGIRGAEGFRFIRCPFEPADQLRWAQEALNEWAEPPHVSNLEMHHGPCPGLWAQHERAPSTASLLRKLSWVTLGYHYNWTERVYEPSRHTPFPPTLASLSAELASACGYALRAEVGPATAPWLGRCPENRRTAPEPTPNAPVLMSGGRPSRRRLSTFTAKSPSWGVTAMTRSRGRARRSSRSASASTPSSSLEARPG